MSQIVYSNGETQTHSRNPSSSGLANTLHHRTLHNVNSGNMLNNLTSSIVGQQISSDLQRQAQLQRDRGCRTQSPTQFKSQAGGLRKISKDISAKKERFADMIVILGLKYNDFVEQKRVAPQVVASYPDLSDPGVAEEHSYIDNLIWICFPEGYSVQGFEKRKEGQICKMKTFHFIITNQLGHKKYITSILFKELFLSDKRGAFIVPKSICLVSSRPIFTLQKQLLILLFQKVILPNNGASIQSHSQHPANYISYLNELNEDVIKRKPDQYLMQRLEFYLAIFFNHLYYLEDVEQDIEVEEIRERSTPSTTMAAKSSQKHKKRIISSFFRYRNTKSYGFTLENYSFELLLQSLKPERILFLITALLLERKIVLIKKNFGDIALIMESLVSLLNPLKWNFVFITYLTPKLVDCLEAPFPYIIGVSRRIWENQCLMRELPDDIIVYDIDNQELLSTVREELPPLPEPQASVLLRSLKDLLDMKERFVEMLQENAPKHINKDKIDEFYWAYAQLRVKQSFFNFFLLTINNYIGYFKNLDEEGDMSPLKKEKQFYDKLSSVDVFDFDNYVNQYEGYNKVFMEKLVKTQSFNNFIEDTYMNTSPKTPIGFFNTNFEVMLYNSFKRLKKEQNKLIDKTFFNLQNPVRFNINHMFKLYKRQLFKKHGDRIKKTLAEEGGIGSDVQTNGARLDLNRQDIFEKLLLSEVEGNANMQLSLINTINQDLIDEMPGIEYEKNCSSKQWPTGAVDSTQGHSFANQISNIASADQISAFQHLKPQKSEHSLQRKASRSGSQAFEFQQKTYQDQQSDNKSRNQNKVSWSGGIKSGGGVVYSNYLSMADNKKGMQEDCRSGQNQALLTSESGTRKLSNFRGAIQPQTRVHSENSFAKNVGQRPLNKTVIVNADQHLYRAPPSGLKAAGSKYKETRLEKSQVIQNPQSLLKQTLSFLPNSSAMNKTLEKARCTSSPRLMKQSSISNAHSSSAMGQNSLIIDKKHQSSKNQLPKSNKTALKETLDRKICKQRTKHGLHLRSDDRLQSQNTLTHNLIQTHQSPLAYARQPKEDMLSTTKTQGMTGPTYPPQNNKQVPTQKIDLMNPQKKKISRNEERKLAKKRGFLGFEQHKSFYSFYSPNQEEFNQLALMQQDRYGQKNSSQLSNFAQSDTKEVQPTLNAPNYNSRGSDEIKLQRLQQSYNALRQSQQKYNHINFSKRQTGQKDSIPSSDAFATTINFQNTFIQQKPQLGNSPTMTNTDFSNSKKSSRYIQDEEEQSFVEQQSPNPQASQKLKHQPSRTFHASPLQMVKDAAQKNPGQSGFDQTSTNPNSLSNRNKDIHSKSKQQHRGHKHTSFQIHNQHQNMPFPLEIDPNDYKKLGVQDKVAEAEEDLTQQKSYEDTPHHQPNKQLMIGKNYSKVKESESPNVSSSFSNLSFKNLVRQANNSRQNTTIGTKKQNVPLTTSNRSPNNNNNHTRTGMKASTKAVATSLRSKNFQGQTFDHTQRVNQDLAKSSATTLQRKRSTPAIKNEKSFTQQNQHPYQATGKLESSLSGKHIPKAPHFKSRPLLDQKNARQPATFLIDLEKKDRQGNSKKSLESQPVMRASPLPEKSGIVSQNHQSYNKEDLKTNSRSSRPWDTSKNFKCSSKTRESRISDKLLGKKKSSSNLLSPIAANGAFDSAPTSGICQPASYKHQNYSQPQSFLRDQGSLSQRSSTVQAKNGMLSFGRHSKRPSQLALKTHKEDMSLDVEEEKDKVSDKDFYQTARQSDLQSQNDGSNNISFSILKNSPRMHHQIIGSRPPVSSKNFFLGGPNSQSLQNSTDMSNVQHMISAIHKNETNNNTSQISEIDRAYQHSAYISPRHTDAWFHKQTKGQGPTGPRTQSQDPFAQEDLMETARGCQVPNPYQLNSKYPRSPIASAQMPSSKQYLQSLQSQEFFLKGNNRKQIKPNQNSSLDPVIQLNKQQKNSHCHGFHHVQSAKNQQNQRFQKHEGKGQTEKYKTQKDTCKSTKTFFPTANKDKLLDEISNINASLNQLEVAKQQARKSGINILEETLTSKSNSNQSYTTSPLNQGFKSSAALKSNALHKAHSQKEDMINSMPTVRNHGYPVKKFDFQTSEYQVCKPNDPESTLEAENELVIADMPRQMFAPKDFSKVIRGDQYNSNNCLRESQLINEIDLLMERKSGQQRMKSITMNAGRQAPSSKSSKTGIRVGGSQLNSKGEPFIELKYHSNEPNLALNKRTLKRGGSSATSLNTSRLLSKNLLLSEKNSSSSLLGDHGRQRSKIAKTRGGVRHGLTTCLLFPTKESNDYMKRDDNQDVFCKINSHMGDVDNDPHTPNSSGSPRSIEKTQRKQQRQLQSEKQGLPISSKSSQISPKHPLPLNQLNADSRSLLWSQFHSGSGEISSYSSIGCQVYKNKALSNGGREKEDRDKQNEGQSLGQSIPLTQQTSFEVAPFQRNRRLEVCFEDSKEQQTTQQKQRFAGPSGVGKNIRNQ